MKTKLLVLALVSLLTGHVSMAQTNQTAAFASATPVLQIDMGKVTGQVRSMLYGLKAKEIRPVNINISVNKAELL